MQFQNYLKLDLIGDLANIYLLCEVDDCTFVDTWCLHPSAFVHMHKFTFHSYAVKLSV